MKRLLAIVGACVFALAVILLASPQFTEKRKAFAAVGMTLLESDYHQIPIAASGIGALKADFNHGVIVRAAEYMGKFGSNTMVFKEVAEVAAEADRECPQLSLVLDLAARSNSDTSRIVALAESACRIENTEDEVAWQAFYESLSDIATYATVEEALVAQAVESSGG